MWELTVYRNEVPEVRVDMKKYFLKIETKYTFEVTIMVYFRCFPKGYGSSIGDK